MPTVSNTSPISNLAWIGCLNLLHEQFSDVWIPQAVETELGNIPDVTVVKTLGEAKDAGWIKTRPVTNVNLVTLLMGELHQGEAEAIALDRLLIDEREGRAMARQLGLPLTGVLGVLLRAKKMKRLTAIKPEIEKLKTKARFFIAPALETSVLEKAGE